MLKSKRTIAILGICTAISSPLSAFNDDFNESNQKCTQQGAQQNTQEDTRKYSQKLADKSDENMRVGIEKGTQGATIAGIGAAVKSNATYLEQFQSLANGTSKIFGALGTLKAVEGGAHVVVSVGQKAVSYGYAVKENRDETYAQAQRKEDTINKVVAREQQTERDEAQRKAAQAAAQKQNVQNNNNRNNKK